MKKILRREEVCKKVRLSKSTIYRMIRKKEFPAPINLSERRVGWLDKDIDKWIRDRGEFNNG